jgi:hypothetical protein
MVQGPPFGGGGGGGGGGGSTTVKRLAEEVPPPGAGLNTVTLTVPVDVISAAEIAVVNLPLFTNVVGRVEPFHCTAELDIKLEPFSVSVKDEPPTVVELGAMDVRLGTGLGGGGAAAIVKVWVLEVPPPGAGLNTVMAAVPDETMSPARVAAVSVVLLR